MISLLTRRAREWGSAIWSNGPELCVSYSFKNEMRCVFDHPARGRDASYHLTSIRQGSRTVADNAIELRTLVAESGWKDDVLQGVFYQGLWDQLKDELATREDSASLDQLIHISIRLDNHLRERRRERASQPSDITSQSLPTNDSPTSPSPSDSGPEPLQLGCARLTPKEQAHRRSANLYLYCCGPGHYITACPSRLPKAQVHH